MSDPLSLLREYIIKKKPVSHDETHIIIGDLRFPRTTLTAYKQDRGRGDPYPLEALYFLLQRPQLAGAAKTRAYNEECRTLGFARVLLADQKDVLAYLTGKTETSQYLVSIDELANIAVPSQADAQAAKPAEKVGEKRQREEPVLDLNDEGMLEAKRHLAQRLDEKVSKPVESGKAGAEERKIMQVENIEANTSLYVRADNPITRSLLERERTLVTRASCLQTKSGKEFSHLISMVKAATQADSGSSHSKPAPDAVHAQPARRDRYNVEARDAYKAAGMDALLLQAEQQGSLLSGAQTTSTGGATSPGPPGTGSERARLGQPIILVPQAPSSMINIFNAKDLLEKGIFKTREEKKAENPEIFNKKDERVTVAHEEDGHTYHYKVVDNVATMKKEDWGRVVAVWVMGPEWQFKKWDLSSFGGKIVNFFSRVNAFHIAYYRDPIPDNIKKWNVEIMTVDKVKRHTDSRVMNTFWDTLKDSRRLASQLKARAAAPASGRPAA